MKIFLISIPFFFNLISANPNFKRTENESKKYGVRGVWLTNVDSEVLNSFENIKEAVSLVDELGFNTIFVVTWNKAMTLYPSSVMKEFTGISINPLFEGRDPLKELIAEAHKKNIKVIAWFEFGFSSSYRLDGGILLEKKPEWSSKNIDGELVTKNGFDWMNGFHPEVQEFLLSLVCEVVREYDIDGIQGDDRLPAMPSEAGYDEYTVGLYKETHCNQNPPANSKDPDWLTFRANLLNEFMTKIYDSVKSINPNSIVSMAPSIFPWSKEEYLQDWPTWIKNNNVDILCPQVYRYTISDYKSTLEEMVKYVDGYNFDFLAPGVLLNLDSYYASEEYLKNVINENRNHNINGEVYFFFEGLKKHKEFFKEIYKDKIDFPTIN